MKTTLSLIAALSATAAYAHPGHIAPEAGHGHAELIALAFIVAAAGALWAFAKR